jgi:DNA-directed RNA polymerase alpha subunit
MLYVNSKYLLILHIMDNQTYNGVTIEEWMIPRFNALRVKIKDLDLPIRAHATLHTAGIDTLADLVSYDKRDLLKFRNFGIKSFNTLQDVVISKDLHFGMDITIYGLKPKKNNTWNTKKLNQPLK